MVIELVARVSRVSPCSRSSIRWQLRVKIHRSASDIGTVEPP